MPLARLNVNMVKFTGQQRMTKQDALSDVFKHVKTNKLYDRSDWNFIKTGEQVATFCLSMGC